MTNITSRFVKLFKFPFKLKGSPLPSSIIPTKKYSLKPEIETKERRLQFGNMNHRSIIGVLLNVSCCTRPDITYKVNKLVKFVNNPRIVHCRAILHLVGFIKFTSSKEIKLYVNIEDSPVYKILKENDFQITEETVLAFIDSF